MRLSIVISAAATWAALLWLVSIGHTHWSVLP
jgi:hypothetical protein